MLEDQSLKKKTEISPKGSGCKERKQSALSSSSSLDIKLELVPGVEKISKLERAASSKQQVKSGKVDLTFIVEERDVKMSWKLPSLEYFNQEKFPRRKYN